MALREIKKESSVVQVTFHLKSITQSKSPDYFDISLSFLYHSK